MTQRHLKELLPPAWLVLDHPRAALVWLLLFGALFRRIVELPGFGAGSYLDYLTPGIVVMTAVSAPLGGMGPIDDIERGTLNRFLITPVQPRGSLTPA